MKRGILIINLFIAGIFVSHGQEYCDTLKWKTINTNYTNWNGNYYDIMGDLDGAVINTDTLSVFYPAIKVVNISNDTFSANGRITFVVYCFLYADTGAIAFLVKGVQQDIGKEIFPNDTTILYVSLGVDLQDLINSAKELTGIELEQISYWEMIIGVGGTSKDGIYSDSVFSAGADTATFRVVRGDVGVQEIEQKASVVSVYPNPAITQLHVERDNYPSLQTDYVIYNIMGQTVLQGKLQESAIINVGSLAKGMYYLRISNTTVKFVKD